MSVCYRYLVKASDSASLAELLETESSRSGRICLLDRAKGDTPPKAGVFRRLIGGLGVKLNATRSIATQDSAFYQRISAQDIKSENPNVCIDIDIPWSWPESVLEPTNWYLISTIFTSTNDSHIEFAHRLSTVCEKVALQSECDHSPGVNTFWFLEHLTEE